MLRGRSRVVFFAIAIGLVAAAASILSAPQSVFPNISLARVEIFADAGELSSEDVRTSVAVPLEAAVATLPGLRATRTFADPGKLELELDFDPASDPQADLRAARAAVDDVRARLPVSDVTTLIEGPEAEPVVTYALTSKSTSQSDLARRAETALVPALTGTPGLGRWTVFGGPERVYDVRLDAKRLAAHGVSARDVSDALASASERHVAGTIVRGLERLPVRSGTPLVDAASIGGVTVRDTHRGGIVSVRELGDVRYADEDTGRQASFDAVHAVLLNIYGTPNGDATALARNIEGRLPDLRAALPSDARIALAWDQTRLVRDSQRALRFEMLVGALIALGAIAFFLRDRALTLTAAIVLPSALALTVVVILRSGLRLDLMTLGGLAIAIGLIVDETIVVVEAIARAPGDTTGSAREFAIASAVRRIRKPLVASTVANLVVFLPLALLGGIPGFFFRALAITLAIALVVSIVLSLVVAPRLALLFGVRSREAAGTGRLETLYVGLLRRVVTRPLIVCAGALAVIAFSAALLWRAPTGFLPNVDEGQFEIKFAMPPGMSARAADALATDFERELLRDPAVASVARLSGVDTNGYVATPPDAGTLRITVADEARRQSFDAIAHRMRREIASVDPNTAVEVHQLLEDQINDLSGAPEPIQITVTGPVQSELARIAGNLADAIADAPGVVDDFDGVTWEARSIAASPRAGDDVSPGAFADTLRARIGGITAFDVQAEDGPVPVVVRVADTVPLAKRVRLGPPVLASTVREENGRRIVRVTAGLENADLSTAIAHIRHDISFQDRLLPQGYSVEVGGAITEQGAAFREFATILAIALILVFGVLLATFDSFRLPLVVLAAVPLTPLGVALALWCTKTPLNVASFMGMLLLVGIVVRNGILLVDGAVRRVAEGAAPADAIERAARERLRPIVMTTLATIGALAPLALGFGAGSELERPLAIAVIGGIVTSTALTLIVVPVLYIVTARRRPTERPRLRVSPIRPA